MNKFVLVNWYKIAIAISSITFSSALLIYSLKSSTVHASPHFKKETTDSDKKAYDQIIILPNGKIYGVYYDVFGWKADYLTSVTP